jgi:CheY-like chemotaxis protein
MKFKALLVCRSQQAVRLLACELDRVDAEVESCPSAQEAVELLARGSYSALVLDFDLPGAAQVAKLARVAPAHRRPVVFAMLGASTDIGETYQAGANFVLYKPLVPAQVARSLRAARGFMRRDRRRSLRQAVQTVVYLLFGRRAAIPALMLDLNEDGLSVQAAEPLPPMDKVPIHFLLPQSNRPVDGIAEVIWADDSGRAGMFFSGLSSSSQRHLKAWLAKQSKKSAAKRVAVASKARAAAVLEA